jgi:hypothetical protein
MSVTIVSIIFDIDKHRYGCHIDERRYSTCSASRQETNEMFALDPMSWSAADDATDPLNNFHARALHEARIATDYRQFEAPAPRGSFFSRIRLALADAFAPATPDTCNCPA